MTINILTQPTFDLIEWEIIHLDRDNYLLFCQTKQVFKFDRCKGTITPRSRVLRHKTIESQFIKSVANSTIDAGYVGKLVFKLELTKEGVDFFGQLKESSNPSLDFQKLCLDFQTQVQNSVQIDLVSFPFNYYGAGHSNFNPNLQPDVVFCGQNQNLASDNMEPKMSDQELIQIYNTLPKSYQEILLTLAKTMQGQSQKGQAKYGTTIDENTNLDPQYWQTHLLEELADGLVYLQKFIATSKN